uniref:Uncharacterized protein n=1 Tax=Rhizophora mucronata TaxID=61149 RepID=A0A2P2NNZ8_RHIMU
MNFQYVVRLEPYNIPRKSRSTGRCAASVPDV